MKSKIIFHDLKMEIPDDTKIITRFYGELMYIIYDAPYCYMHFTGTQKYKVDVTLQDMMDNLPEVFVRCNRSIVLNVCYYKEYDMNLSTIIMDDNRKGCMTNCIKRPF